MDFWEHTKSHIKAEKLLTCPKCPFVTEYKHHLEYHLRNHFGSKPFKCTKCAYSCVNKSMLNSHLKSHSNIYQYRCADCAYATKYCHSLKLHLRKYDHSPAMVLNQDGSPNPLPIIDVYGTRRGPKQKPKHQEDGEKHNLPGGVVVPVAPHQVPEESQPKLIYCTLCEFYTVSLEVLNQHMYLHAAESPFAHMLRTNNNIPDQAAVKDYFQNVFLSLEPPVSPLSLVSPHQSPLAYQPISPLDLSKPEPESNNDRKPTDGKKNRRKGKAYKLERAPEVVEVKQAEVQPIPDDFKMKQNPIRSPILDSVEPEMKYESGMTNSFQDVSMQNGHTVEKVVVKEEAYKQVEVEVRQPSPVPLKIVRPTEEVDMKMDVADPIRDSFKIKIPSWKGRALESVTETEPTAQFDKEDPEGYSCDFCDMAFKDVVMYTMHMGYHGYRDPFTCNMCGQATPNRVAFFLHIARSSHS